MFETREAFDAKLESWSDAEDDVDDPDPVFWDKSQPDRTDENYNGTVITWQGVCRFDFDEDEWKVKIKKFKSMVRAQFQLQHDIRWLGIVKTFRTPGQPNSGGRNDIFFRVHNDDISKLYVANRIDLCFFWFFDVVQHWPGQLIYPLHFRRTYRP